MTLTPISVSAIDPTRLSTLYGSGRDERGTPLEAFDAEGWEPLRCCLNMSRPGESIALISHSPFESSSPWSETGPVFIHATACGGYTTPGELPAALRTGPKILRTYRADGTLHYDHIAEVDAGADLDEPIRSLLAVDDVATVHVRALKSQCFAYSVTAGQR